MKLIYILFLHCHKLIYIFLLYFFVCKDSIEVYDPKADQLNIFKSLTLLCTQLTSEQLKYGDGERLKSERLKNRNISLLKFLHDFLKFWRSSSQKSWKIIIIPYISARKVFQNFNNEFCPHNFPILLGKYRSGYLLGSDFMRILRAKLHYWIFARFSSIFMAYFSTLFTELP